jgi:hypothetical protein
MKNGKIISTVSEVIKDGEWKKLWRINGRIR